MSYEAAGKEARPTKMRSSKNLRRRRSGSSLGGPFVEEANAAASRGCLQFCYRKRMGMGWVNRSWLRKVVPPRSSPEMIRLRVET
ncbi:hypothetical protein Csa_015866 [Cucumis sativus]|uniref:Uncharacterized protein n=1 Tax=Cucumis sativus TaxID=3659 RepID=A0A0A0K695_CUCSA|nr:hypothetical protein Csa_015866 [Cucumis sativus]